MKPSIINHLTTWLLAMTGLVVGAIAMPSAAQAQVTLENVCTTGQGPLSPSPGATPLSPGRWWNPARNGTGWDIHFGPIEADGRRVFSMAWFSYNAQGRPTWYVAHGAKLDPGQVVWSGVLSQATWDFQSQSRGELQRRGEIEVRFQPADASRLAIQWRLDGQPPQGASWEPAECLRDFGIAAQGENTPARGIESVTPAYSGGWIARQLEAPRHTVTAWSLYQTVLSFTRNGATVFRESAIITTYDDAGQPVWLDATDQDAPEPTSLALGAARTLPFNYYYVTGVEYPNGKPNTPCASHVNNCARRAWVPPSSSWTRTFNAPGTCDGRACMTGVGHPIIQVPSSSPTGQAITRLLPGSQPSRELEKIGDLNTIFVDKALCRADVDGTCQVSVSWSSDQATPVVRRVRLTGSTGSSTDLNLSTGRHGALIDTLRVGDLVRYEMVGQGGVVLHSTPSVRVEQIPLRIDQVTATPSANVGPTSITLTAVVAGGVPPLQVEYYEAERLLGVTRDGTPHRLQWNAVGPGSYRFRFVVRDSSSTPREVRAFVDAAVAAPAPASAPARTSLEQVSDSVGTLPGSFRVDESGGATYAVPLTLPPGRAGVTPQLGLQYSSQGGDGSLGRGWSLSGLSNITRCRRTREAGDFNVTHPGGAVFEDFEGITFTDSDAFCLDGQRLLNAATSAQTGCRAVSGHTATEMRTEIDSHQRVCAYRSTSLATAGPRFFSVESKDGQRRWYGLHNGTGQPQQPVPSIALPILTAGASLEGPIYLWALNRSLDSVGNYIDYFYNADMAISPGAVGVYERIGALLIQSIQYSGRVGGSAPHSEVRFAYQGGQLQRDHFVNGRRFSTSRRLQQIDVLDNAVLQRRYKLNYLSLPAAVPYDGRSRHLQSLQECAPENPSQPEGAHVCLQPTRFSYGGSDPDSAQPGTAHAGLDRPFGAPVRLTPIETGSAIKFEGKKIADIDGDGLSDIVWIKDLPRNETCGGASALSTSAVRGTEIVNVAFSRVAADGSGRRVSFSNQLAFCTPAELLNRTFESTTDPDESWFLYDYNRDGRADIFFRGDSAWHGLLATGNPASPFDLNNDVLRTSPIPAGNEVKYFPRPVDLNGDGLMDLIRVDQGLRGNTLRARIHATASGASKPSPHAWAREIAVTHGDPCLANPNLRDRQCSAALVGLFDEDGFERQVDLNGDGATDVFLAFNITAVWPSGGPGGGGPGNPGYPDIHPVREAPTTSPTTRLVWVPLRVARVSSELVHLEPLEGTWAYGGAGRYTQHVDLNGDGLTDTASLLPQSTPFPSGFSLNGGGASMVSRVGGLFNCNPLAYHQTSPGLVDINGDGLLDFYAFENDLLRIYPNTGGFERRGEGTAHSCNTLYLQQAMEIGASGDPTSLKTWYEESRPPGTDRRELMFGDWDSDGLTDLLVLVAGNTNNLHLAHVPRLTSPTLPPATRRADPPGLLTAITDGLGGRTEITYRPLSHPAVYRADRTTDDSLYGRGSAVHDVRGAIQVVARVETSAPGLTSASRKARLYYRYVGAKMQSGGRGLLGFREIHTIDPNHGPMEAGDKGAFALTISSYRQQFPFIGLPDTTERWVVRELWAETACFQNTAVCTERLDQPFATPDVAWPGRARLLSDATEDYVFAWTSSPSVELTAFNGQGRAPEPVQVRRVRSQEHTYDLRSGVALNASVQLYRYLASNGVADPYGNVLRTRSFVFSANPQPTADGQDYTNHVSRTETQNTYLNLVDSSTWYPGRLQLSRVSHQRTTAGAQEIVRVSEFGYDNSTGPLRGLLLSETVRAEGSPLLPQTAANAVADQRDERVRTFYRYDDFGNRIGSFTCDLSISEQDCTNPSPVSFSGTDPLRVHRWTRTLYTSDGRFVRATESPYAIGVRKDSEVLAHSAYGQPLLVRDLNGGYTRYSYGRFGRAAYQWTQTVAAKSDVLNGGIAANGQGPGLSLGVESRTHYAWCQGVPGVTGTVACPAGAVYRQTTEGTEQPRGWAYFDALARPVLQVGELFNEGVQNAERSASCQDYDVQGRSFRQSAPRLLSGAGEPTAAQLSGFCSSTPSHHWTETEFDVLGRSVVQWSAEESGRARTEIRYEGLLTRTTLPSNGDGRTRQRSETRNVLGELVEVRDGEGLGAVATYAYSATGDLLSVTRTGSGTTVVSRMFYDRMGRKLRTEDPDAGVWNYRYNAAGELIAQYDGDYVQTALPVPTGVIRTLQQFDGRGRVIEKQSYAAGSASGVTHYWRYDYEPGGPFGQMVGMLSSESNTGSYDASGNSNIRFDRYHHYDDLGRPAGSRTQFDGTGPSYYATAHYDTRGRVWKTMDASLRWLKTEYSARGFQRAQCESTGLDVGLACASNHEDTYMRVLSVDAWGKVTQEQRGNNLAITSAYAASTGRLLSRCMGNSSCDLQLDTYNWDPLGNLLWRERSAGATNALGHSNLYNSAYAKYRETFAYDSLNRVISGQLGLYTTAVSALPSLSATSLSMAYDALGNVCQRSVNGNTLFMHYLNSAGCNGSAAAQNSMGVSSYSSPHALTRVSSSVGAATFTSYGYDAHGNQVSAQNVGGSTALPASRTVEYTPEQQAWRLAQGNELTRFFYGPDGARYRRIDQGGGSTTETRYLGNVELIVKNTVPQIRRYLAGVAVMEINPTLNTRTVKRLLHDHLGSVSLAVSNDASRMVLERYDYDAFGQRRAALGDPRGSWSYNPNQPPPTNRGFTGHEMLDAFGIVHMNGRIYDSRTARFLQADPFVQEPNNPQNFNRFTYLWNNPLNATDPSGYLGVKERQALAVVVAIVAVATQQYWLGGAFKTGAGAFWYSVATGAIAGGISTQSWNGAMWGAFSAAAFYGVGEAFPAKGVKVGDPRWYQRVVAHGLVGGTMSVAQGGKFGHGFVSAGASAGAGPWIDGMDSIGAGGRVAVAALVGGTVSAATGGKFANGAVTAAFSRAFNDCQHGGCGRPIDGSLEGSPGYDPDSEIRAVSAVSVGRRVHITYSDGSVEIRSGGTRSWRNNNPGNVIASRFARSQGSIGEAGGFAVFPTVNHGQLAKVALLRGSSYASRTLDGAIERYAPPSENDTPRYQSYIRQKTGIDGSSSFGSLSESQLNAVVRAMRNYEGWRAGDVTVVSP